MKKLDINLSIRILLSAVFLISAYSKAAAPGIIEIILAEHGIIQNREISAYLVRILIGFEFSLALLLLQKNYLRKIVIPSVFFFLSAFTLYLLYAAIIVKDNQNCGCFGTLIKMSPVESIIKNIFLILLTLILFRRTQTDSKNKIIPLLFLILPLAAVFIISPIRENKDFIFGKYTEFSGAGRVDLAEGEKLLFLFTLDCDHCQQAARDLIELQKKYNIPPYYTLFFQEGDVTVDSFKTLTGFSSPYKIVGSMEFFELIGTNPPRCYKIKDGKIDEIWDKDIKQRLLENYSNR